MLLELSAKKNILHLSPLATYDNSLRNKIVYILTIRLYKKSDSREVYYHTSPDDEWGACLG